MENYTLHSSCNQHLCCQCRCLTRMITRTVENLIKNIPSDITEDQIREIVESIVTDLISNITEDQIREIVNEIISDINETINEAVNEAVDKAINEATGDIVENITNNVIERVTGNIEDTVKNLIEEALQNLTVENDNFGYIAQQLSTGTFYTWESLTPLTVNNITLPNENIEYNDGVFTILKSGNYFINIQSFTTGGLRDNVMIDVTINNENYVELVSDRGECIAVSTYLKVTDTPTTVSFINHSPSTLNIYNADVLYTITIIKF